MPPEPLQSGARQPTQSTSVLVDNSHPPPPDTGCCDTHPKPQRTKSAIILQGMHSHSLSLLIDDTVTSVHIHGMLQPQPPPPSTQAHSCLS